MKAITAAYQKQKGQISVPGFRKGKVPQAMVEKMYGAGIFYEEAANAMINENYPKATAESELDIVSQPEIDVVQLEKRKIFSSSQQKLLLNQSYLGEYKGVEVEKAVVEVTDEEIEAELKKEQEKTPEQSTLMTEQLRMAIQ